MKKVSIIVPVYNTQNYIKKCVDSLVNQSYKNIEILLVNNDTPDKSIEIVKENYNDDRIKIINKKGHCAASARNYGIKKASGDFIMFVDSDDFVNENMVEDMINAITIDNSNLVICDYYKYYENGNKEHISIIPHYEKDNEKCSVISMPGPVCKLFKKELFDKYNLDFLEDHIFEDNAIMPFACAVSGKFSYLNKPYYYYLQREGSSLNKKEYDKKWEDIFDSLEYLYKKFKEYDMINMFKDEIEYIYIEYLLHAANLRFIKYEEGYENIYKVSDVIKKYFPNWKNNKYYKMEGIKYKIICSLFYMKKIKIVKRLLKQN